MSSKKSDYHLTIEECRELDTLVGKTFRKANAETIRDVIRETAVFLRDKGDQDYRERVLTNQIIRHSNHPYTNSELKRLIQKLLAEVKNEENPD